MLIYSAEAHDTFVLTSKKTSQIHSHLTPSFSWILVQVHHLIVSCICMLRSFNRSRLPCLHFLVRSATSTWESPVVKGRSFRQSRALAFAHHICRCIRWEAFRYRGLLCDAAQDCFFIFHSHHQDLRFIICSHDILRSAQGLWRHARFSYFFH